VSAAPDLRMQLIETGRALLRDGLVSGTAGNLSARLPGGALLSPAAHACDALRPEDLVVVDMDGAPREGSRPPSSELALHLACLRRHPEIGAVIHTHPRYATMFALARRAIPCAMEEFGMQVGGAVPVARFRPAGSEALGAEAARHLGERSAVLMANHGLLTVGRNLAQAHAIAALVERTAQMCWGALALGGIAPLPRRARQRIAEHYRRRRAGAD